MKLVIQTNRQIVSPLQIAEADKYLKKVHASEVSPPLEIGETKYHYLQIDDTTDIDWLIPILMAVPGIEAAYQKPTDLPAG